MTDNLVLTYNIHCMPADYVRGAGGAGYLPPIPVQVPLREYRDQTQPLSTGDTGDIGPLLVWV